MTILIANGEVVSPDGITPLDVLVDGERIVAVLPPGSTVLGDVAASADRVIDATGRYVMPGGVDVHTHMELPSAGTVASDTFESGTRAAAWGGTTTIVDFAIQQAAASREDARAGSLREGLDTWHAKADGNCAIDYAFHMIMADVNESSLKEMEA